MLSVVYFVNYLRMCKRTHYSLVSVCVCVNRDNGVGVDVAVPTTNEKTYQALHSTNNSYWNAMDLRQDV